MSADDLEKASGEPRSTDPFARLPKYSEFVSLRLPGTEICCNECGRYRAGTKGYMLLYIAYFLLFGFIRTLRVVKCPACMRYYLVSRLPLALLMANLASPVILVWWTFLLIRTFLQ